MYLITSDGQITFGELHWCYQMKASWWTQYWQVKWKSRFEGTKTISTGSLLNSMAVERKRMRENVILQKDRLSRKCFC